jgi:hypothetical protein
MRSISSTKIDSGHDISCYSRVFCTHKSQLLPRPRGKMTTDVQRRHGIVSLDVMLKTTNCMHAAPPMLYTTPSTPFEVNIWHVSNSQPTDRRNRLWPAGPLVTDYRNSRCNMHCMTTYSRYTTCCAWLQAIGEIALYPIRLSKQVQEVFKAIAMSNGRHGLNSCTIRTSRRWFIECTHENPCRQNSQSNVDAPIDNVINYKILQNEHTSSVTVSYTPWVDFIPA